MNRLAKILIIAIMLLVLPLKQWGQEPFRQYADNGILMNFHKIDNIDFRVFLLYNLSQDNHFILVADEEPGQFIISADDENMASLNDEFNSFYHNTYADFMLLSKDDIYALMPQWKSCINPSQFLSITLDVALRNSRTSNNHCVDSDPFCTTDEIQFNAAATSQTADELEGTTIQDGCIGSSYNPSWYHMRIQTAGPFVIHVEGHDPNNHSTTRDVDFCMWGPYSDPTSPCVSQLTTSKIIDCSYSASYSENIYLGYQSSQHDHGYSDHGTIHYHVPQVGEYYILMITNYSQAPCTISFTKTEGDGETDCGILPGIADNDGPYCVGETIHLTVNAQDGASYSWVGPDGWTSTLQNPNRTNCTAAMAGTYTCTTTIGSQTASDTTNVVVLPQPTANFTATTVCQGNATQFTNTSTTNPSGQSMTYHWSFGNGQTSTEQNPSCTYATPGTYSVTLTVTSGNGHCTDTKTQTVTVYAEPVANAGPDQTIPLNNSTQLNGSGGAGTFNFHWEPANMVTNPNAQNTQTVSLTQDQTYILTVTNPQGGCSSTDEVTVHIEGSALTATANAAPSSICQGGSTQLTANAGGGLGSSTYSWSPTTGLSNPNIYNPVATPTQTTTYTCTVHNAQTNQTTTASVTVTVNAALEGDYYTTICDNEFPHTFHSVEFHAAGEQTITLPNATPQGCDSIVTLHVDIYPSYDENETTPIQEEICDGESYTFDVQGYHDTYTESVSIPYRLETIHGCDSIVRLNLTKWDANPIIDDPRDICVGQTLPWIDGNEYDQDGTVAYYDSIDSHGCQQIYKLLLSVGEYQTPLGYDPNVFVCVPHDDSLHYHWDIANRDYDKDTSDFVIIPSDDGCPYKYRLNLKFHKEFYQVERPVDTCDLYIWPLTEERFTETDHHIERTFQYHFGFGENQVICDSTYILDITINNSEYLPDVYLGDSCDFTHVTWYNDQDTTFTENTVYTFVGSTEEGGCHREQTYHIEGMRYSPQPEIIKPSSSSTSFFSLPEGDTLVSDTAMCAAVVTNTEFFSFQYTFYVKETNSKCVWESCDWVISKPSWNIDYAPPKRGADGMYYSECTVHVADRDNDYVALTATIGNGCNSDTRKIYLKSSFLDIDEYNSIPAEVNIMPNPNNGQMHIDFENMEGRTFVKVFDMTGNQIDAFETTINSNRYNYEYNMKRHADGIYFFVVSNNNRVLTKKVVVIH